MGDGLRRTTRVAVRVLVAALAAAVVLAGCGGDDDEAETSPTRATSGGTTTVPPPPTVPPSVTLPESGPVVVESALYPYALTVPVERFSRPFRPARRPWDRESAPTRASDSVDHFPFGGGELFIVGAEWAGDLETFAQMYVDITARTRGCSQPKNQRDVTVAGERALLFTVDSCGGSVAFVRLAVLHEGFGVVAFTETASGLENEHIDRFLADLAGFEWRAR